MQNSCVGVVFVLAPTRIQPKIGDILTRCQRVADMLLTCPQHSQLSLVEAEVLYDGFTVSREGIAAPLIIARPL
jgi:hypothetical protein